MRFYKQLRNKMTKVTVWFILIALVIYPVSPVIALEAPTAPQEPTAPSLQISESQTAPTASQEPDVPSVPSTPEDSYNAPSAPETPTYQQTQGDSQQDNQTVEQDVTNNEADGNTGPSLPLSQTSVQPLQQTTTQGGQVGNTEIDTGNALAKTILVSSANNNTAGSGSSAQLSGQPGGSVANTDNGSGSQNNWSASINDNNTTTQDNTAHVSSGIIQDAATGDNNALNNVGNTTVSTGDANSTGTLLTAVNTNTDGVTVSEFNIVDDHVGDVVLDFAANCILGCSSGDVSVKNTGNGSNSDNTAQATSLANNETFQNNDAVVENQLVLDASSGNNVADANTGGDTSIDTGDANVSANSITLANNNIAGNVVIGVVNIFGDLIGDILFPQDQLQCCGSSSTTTANTGNGSNTTNDASVATENTNSTFQTNDATIANNIIFDTTTGDNSASGNTGGNTEIATGDTSIDANVLNVANSNVSGGNWWLVIVNEAGNWVGKILGSPDNASFAGSDGTQFSVDPNGVITASNAANAAVNSGNGSGSNNTAQASASTNSTTVQNNSADITNNLKLSANTGGNSTSNNTGGNNSIQTGDANIVANLINFVNDNVAGNGKLFVTVVNVFGNWLGDFVTPGQQKPQKPSQPSVTTADSNQQLNVGGASGSTGGNTSSSTATQTSDTKNTTNNTLTPASSTQTEALAQGNIGLGGVSTTSRTSVKGVSAHIDDALENQVKNKSIRINLAWLLVLIPVLVGVAVGRRFFLAKLLPRK